MCLGQHQFCPNYRLQSRLLTNLEDSGNKRWFSKIKLEGISCEAINHYLQNAHHSFFADMHMPRRRALSTQYTECGLKLAIGANTQVSTVISAFCYMHCSLSLIFMVAYLSCSGLCYLLLTKKTEYVRHQVETTCHHPWSSLCNFRSPSHGPWNIRPKGLHFSNTTK
jgi:hypothetical protein